MKFFLKDSLYKPDPKPKICLQDTEYKKLSQLLGLLSYLGNLNRLRIQLCLRSYLEGSFDSLELELKPYLLGSSYKQSLKLILGQQCKVGKRSTQKRATDSWLGS